MLKVESAHLDFDSGSIGGLSGVPSLKKKQTCLEKCIESSELACIDLKEYDSMLSDFSKLEFDIFAIAKQLERKNILPICMMNAIDQLELQSLIDQTKFESFLRCVQRTYIEEV